MEKRSSIVLSNPSDWDGWLLEVKAQALASGVPWNLINPYESSKPQGIPEPRRPKVHKSGSKSSSVGKKDDDETDMGWSIYQIDLGRYEKQQKSLGSLSLYILKHTSPHLFSLLAYRGYDPHPWGLLRALEERVAPSDCTRQAMVRREIKDLKAMALKDEDDLAWLDRWDLVISQAFRFPAISVGVEAYQTLLTRFPLEADLAIDRYHNSLTEGDEGPNFTLQEFVGGCRERIFKDFREVWKERLMLKERNSEPKDTSDRRSPGRATPDSEDTVSQTNQKANSNGPPQCLCGNFEYYSRCLYLNKALRPPHWEPDPERQQLVAVSLTDPAVADKVDKSLRRWKKKQATQTRLDDDDKSSVSTIKLWPGQL